MAVRRVRVGDLVTEGLLNAIIDVANRCDLNVPQGGNLKVESGPAGVLLTAIVPRPIYGKITGPISSGAYPFLLQYPVASGGWSDGTFTGVAAEQNGNASVPTGKVVELKLIAAEKYSFEYGAC